MNTRRYPIVNQRLISTWFETDKQLDFGNLNDVLKINRPWRWVVLASIWALKRFKMLKPCKREHEGVQTIQVEYNNLARFIMERHHELISRYGVKDLVVIMGSRMFMELQHQASPMAFPMVFNLSDFETPQNRLCGMLVIVLPWMDGTVLVPKEYMPIDERIVKIPVPATDEECREMRQKFEGEKAAALWNNFMGREPLED